MSCLRRNARKGKGGSLKQDDIAWGPYGPVRNKTRPPRMGLGNRVNLESLKNYGATRPEEETTAGEKVPEVTKINVHPDVKSGKAETDEQQ